MTPPGGVPGVREYRGYHLDGSPSSLSRYSSVLSQLLAHTLSYDHRGKVKEAVRSSQVQNQSEHASMRYDGMGALLAYERTLPGGTGYDVEEYRNDALGNVVYSRSRSSSGGPAMWYHSSYSIRGQLFERWNQMPTTLPSGAFEDETSQQYGGGGSLISLAQRRQSKPDNAWLSQEATRHYYDGEDRLAAVQRYSWTPGGNAGVWEEYRYDALGRRIMTRTRRENGFAGEDPVTYSDPWVCARRTRGVSPLVGRS